MVRFIFAFVMLAHGLIHLLGFIKAFNLGNVSQLTGKTIIPLSAGLSKVTGMAWVVVCILFLIGALLFLFKKDSWWVVALIALLISQILIIIHWQDARFGTLANAIILLGCLPALGAWNFEKMVSGEIDAFFTGISSEEKMAKAEDSPTLPPIVQRWLKRANADSKSLSQTVFLTQEGEMKISPDGNWMHLQARQYFTTGQPGFLWIADVQGNPFMQFAGRDKYQQGEGHMLIKLFSLFPVVNASGPAMDQGALSRYLAEIIWFPMAAFHGFITWEPLDSTAVKATINDGSLQESGLFRFNEEGDVIRFETERYYYRKAGATLETWVIDIDENSFREFDGIRIPTLATVTWKLKEDDFTWLKLEITDIHYENLNLGQ